MHLLCPPSLLISNRFTDVSHKSTQVILKFCSAVMNPSKLLALSPGSVPQREEKHSLFFMQWYLLMLFKSMD